MGGGRKLTPQRNFCLPPSSGLVLNGLTTVAEESSPPPTIDDQAYLHSALMEAPPGEEIYLLASYL